MNLAFSLSVLVLGQAVVLLLLGVPPFDHIAYHYFTMYHPVARQMKAIDAARGLQIGAACASALELGIVDLLDKRRSEGMLSSQVAEALGVPVRGVEPLLQVLASSYYLYQDRLVPILSFLERTRSATGPGCCSGIRCVRVRRFECVSQRSRHPERQRKRTCGDSREYASTVGIADSPGTGELFAPETALDSNAYDVVLVMRRIFFIISLRNGPCPSFKRSKRI
jgi:hypothetical protein